MGSAYAPAFQIGQGQILGQASRAHYFHVIGIDLGKDIGTFQKPVTMHDGIRDHFAQCIGRILQNILSLQTLNATGNPSVALNELRCILNVRHDSFLINPCGPGFLSCRHLLPEDSNAGLWPDFAVDRSRPAAGGPAA